jgi:uncharacterized protein
MVNITDSQREHLTALCRQFGVRRLDLFGSAATGATFNAATSDYDFLVDIEDMPPSAYADAYFGLLEALTALLQKPVDLVTVRAVKNPYFLKSIEQSRVPLYVA